MLNIIASAILALLVHPVNAQTPTSGQNPLDEEKKLLTKITVRAPASSVSAVLTFVSAESGVEFRCDEPIKRDHVILYAHRRPAKDVLAAIASFFNYEWKRSEADGHKWYTLSEKPVLRKDVLRYSERTLQSADRILSDFEVLRRFVDKPDAEIAARLTALSSMLEIERDFNAYNRTNEERAILTRLMDDKPGYSFACKLLESYDRYRIAELLEIHSPAYFTESSKRYRLNAELASTVEKDMIAYHQHWAEVNKRHWEELNKQAGLPALRTDRFDKISDVGLSVEAHQSESPQLQIVARASVPGGFIGAFGIVLPITQRRWPENDTPGPPRTAWSAVPLLRKIMFAEVPHPRSEHKSLVSLPLVCDAIEVDHPVDLIADCPWKSGGTPIGLEEGSLGDTLNWLATWLQFKWDIKDGWIVFRTRFLEDRANARRREQLEYPPY